MRSKTVLFVVFIVVHISEIRIIWELFKSNEKDSAEFCISALYQRNERVSAVVRTVSFISVFFVSSK